MLYLIADIKTYITSVGGLSSYFEDYVIDSLDNEAEIVIDDSKYNYDYWHNLGLNKDEAIYMESGFQFYRKLLDFNGMMLHASATVIDNETYLFVGQSGIGKSTHAQLLIKQYPSAKLINDDKPALRLVNDKWMVYGTPWSGKNYININTKYPLKAICLLTTRRDRNYIQKADSLTAIANLIASSTGRGNKESIKKLSTLIDKLIKDIPVYIMDSHANDESAIMAYNSMKNGL